MKTPVSTVQIDLDGRWVLRKMVAPAASAAGDDPLFASGMPALLRLLDEHGIRATLFVNALDLEHRSQRAFIEGALDAGHEIGCHGLSHSYLTALDRAGKERELGESAERIHRVLGVRPRGFRAPGYAVDREVPAVLQSLGYLYDCSAFPSVALAGIVAYQRLIARPPRPRLPWLRQLTTPVVPYQTSADDLYRPGRANLWELPVTPMPAGRLPINFSYGVLLGAGYVELGARLALRRYGIVNYLFHLLDFADFGGDPELRRLAPRHGPVAKRLAGAARVLRLLRERSEVLTTTELYERATSNGTVHALGARSGRW